MSFGGFESRVAVTPMTSPPVVSTDRPLMVSDER